MSTVPPAPAEAHGTAAAAGNRPAPRLNLRPDSFSLTLTGGDVHAFDLEGRPLTWFSAGSGTLHKRSLETRVLSRRAGPGGRQRWEVSGRDLTAFLAARHAELRSAAHQLEAAWEPLGTAAGPQQRALTLALGWTPERLLAERERFAAAYTPVSILPPDQYQAVVVQATRGCSWNRCTFCNFYQGQPFSVLSPEQFAAHLERVAALLGAGVHLRRSLFLGDGNALMVSNRRLLPLLDAARAAFPDRPVFGFVDVMTGAKKSVEDWAELRGAGLQRVYLGLETGNDALLQWLGKPGSQAAALELAGTLRAAGLRLGPILMAGAGGQPFAAAHTAATATLLRRLPLERGDVVYLSPFVSHPGSLYAQRATAEGAAPLSEAEIRRQMDTWAAVLREAHPGVSAVPYRIDEFLY